jgi:SAM-dependent methyltransferase
LKENIDINAIYNSSIDLGSSGNSFLIFLENLNHKSFLDIAAFPLKQYKNGAKYHPLRGDLTRLPYRDKSFDFVSALDVLEHIKHDQLAISEMSRILKEEGILFITVPHRMKYYTHQDRIIGHYRRYEIDEIISRFTKFNLKHLKTFGIYGQLMRVSDIQSANPTKLEENLISLRLRYESNRVFRRFWNVVVKVLSLFMKLDAKYLSIQRMMNLALVFKKV